MAGKKFPERPQVDLDQYLNVLFKKAEIRCGSDHKTEK